MRAFGFVLALVAGLFAASKADAAIVVRVDKSTQTMRVIVDGEHRYTWAVSTGRAGYNTPNGSYRPQRLERTWRSRKYGMAPMPYSIFFRGGYAIHGTNMVGRLGRVDSHGCIRLAPGNARTLFEMVGRRRGATRIVIEGTSPRSYAPAVASRRTGTRVATAPSRPAQMRLAQPTTARAVAPRTVRAVAPGTIRAAVPGSVRSSYPASGSHRVATHHGQARAAYAVPRGGYAQPTVRHADQNRYFMDWFLRR